MHFLGIGIQRNAAQWQILIFPAVKQVCFSGVTMVDCKYATSTLDYLEWYCYGCFYSDVVCPCGRKVTRVAHGSFGSLHLAAAYPLAHANRLHLEANRIWVDHFRGNTPVTCRCGQWLANGSPRHVTDVLQCAAACCSVHFSGGESEVRDPEHPTAVVPVVLQCVAACCSVYFSAVSISAVVNQKFEILHIPQLWCGVLQRVAACCSVYFSAVSISAVVNQKFEILHIPQLSAMMRCAAI